MNIEYGHLEMAGMSGPPTKASKLEFSSSNE